jgi:hypothetical protein
MKKLLPFLLLAFVAVFVACDKDDDASENVQLLSYDGSNANAPDLPAGNYVFGVRFPPNETEVFQDSLLTEVRFYVKNPPNSLRVRVYGPGMNEAPGDLLYESNALTALVETESWYTHTLTEPVTITGEELWLGVSFSHTSNLRSIGCDSGPAVANGDFIFDESLNTWTKFSVETPESVNWNIRGRVGQ